MLSHLASRVFGTPLLVHRAKLAIILAVMGERLGIAPACGGPDLAVCEAIDRCAHGHAEGLGGDGVATQPGDVGVASLTIKNGKQPGEGCCCSPRCAQAVIMSAGWPPETLASLLAGCPR